jgi:hypothetical protein
MSFEQDLYSFLSQNADVLAALGGKNSLYKVMMPKGKPLPAVVMQTIYFWPYYAAEGSLNAFKKRIQFDTYAEKATDVSTISDTFRHLLTNLSGSLGNNVVQASFVTRDMDMGFEQGPDDGYTFRRLIWVEFFYYEVTPALPVSPTLPAPPTGDNAAYFQGVPVSPTVPQDGQVLVYNAADQEYEPETVSGAGGSTDDGHF